MPLFVPLLPFPPVPAPPARITFAQTAAGAAPAPPAPSPVIAPLPLPDPALPDSAYKAALDALLKNPEKRRGVLTTLLIAGNRDTPPAHVRSVVALLIEQLNTGNPLEMVMPVRALGRCGGAARPAFVRVLTLSNSPLSPVREAVADSLGGIFAAPRKITRTPPPVCPPAATATLLLLARDPHYGTRHAAVLSLGRTRVASDEVLDVITKAISGTDSDLALAGLSAARSLGSAARSVLPAIKKCLSDGQTVTNAVPALMAVTTPQDATDAMAGALAAADDFTVQQTLVYYAGVAPTDRTLDTAAFAAAVKPLMKAGSAGKTTPPAPTDAPPLPPAPVADDSSAPAPTPTGTDKPSATAPPHAADRAAVMPAPEDAAKLRLSAARAYLHLSADSKDAVATLAALVSDTSVPASTRARALQTLATQSDAVLQSPPVLSALKLAVADANFDLQDGAIRILSKTGGSTAQALAPRLSDLLLASWKQGQDARVFNLINTLYRIGPAAKDAATPVLKQIIHADPPNSPNAKLASLALARFAAP